MGTSGVVLDIRLGFSRVQSSDIRTESIIVVSCSQTDPSAWTLASSFGFNPADPTSGC